MDPLQPPPTPIHPHSPPRLPLSLVRPFLRGTIERATAEAEDLNAEASRLEGEIHAVEAEVETPPPPPHTHIPLSPP